MRKRVAVFLRPGSNWNPNKGVREQALWDEHARFIDDLFARDVVLLAGPFVPEGSGALVILNVESPAETHAIYADDPWRLADILLVEDAKEWSIFLDAWTKQRE